jgi:hypothetical protein
MFKIILTTLLLPFSAHCTEIQDQFTALKLLKMKLPANAAVKPDLCANPDFGDFGFMENEGLVIDTSMGLKKATDCAFELNYKLDGPNHLSIDSVELRIKSPLVESLTLSLGVEIQAHKLQLFSFPTSNVTVKTDKNLNMAFMTLIPAPNSPKTDCLQQGKLLNKFRLTNISYLGNEQIEISEIKIKYKKTACLPTEIIDIKNTNETQ